MAKSSAVNPAFWSGKRTLVTGASGFLGGSLVARLLEYGAEVVAVVRGNRPESRFSLDGLELRSTVVVGDVATQGTIESIFKTGRIDAAFHLAANSDVEDAYLHPAESYRAAIESTLHLMEATRTQQPACVAVVSSSDKAYGPQPVPYLESNNLAPQHPYEVAKATQDLIAQSYGKVYGLPVSVTRCANYFGGWDFNWHRIIPGTIRSVLNGQRVTLRSDGKFTRDFLFIEDAVDVQLILAERLASDTMIRGEAFNFSYEVNIEILDIVKRLCTLLDYRGEPEINATAKAEIRFMQVNCDKARAMLGWQPAYDFDEALAETVTWYRNYLTEHVNETHLRT